MEGGTQFIGHETVKLKGKKEHLLEIDHRERFKQENLGRINTVREDMENKEAE